jgi:hypothetical protein
MGELEMMQYEHVEQALSPIEHLCKNLLKSNCKSNWGAWGKDGGRALSHPQQSEEHPLERRGSQYAGSGHSWHPHIQKHRL